MRNSDSSGIPPVTMSIAEAVKWSGLSRSELYRQLSRGTIAAVKNRSRTLIVIDTLRAFLINLPAATFRKPRGG